jgi:DNA-binding transcriptional LysR family regulator
MDVHQLEVFLAVIESSSMAHAAERVHLSVGAVSLQLHKLAAELRTELFVRAGKRLAPTPAAARLAEHARAVVKLMNQIRQDFADDLTQDVRPFHFATGVTTLIYQLGRPLRRLRKQFPNTDIRITVSVTEDIVAGLLDRRFDLGLISLPVSEERLRIIPLFEEELLLLRPSPSKVGGGHVGSIRPGDLAGLPFILYPGRSNIRLVIDGFFERLSVKPNVVMEADDTEAIKRLVESGFGYSILPERALRGRSYFFHTLRVKGDKLTRTLALATARADYPRKLTESIASFLQNALAQP